MNIAPSDDTEPQEKDLWEKAQIQSVAQNPEIYSPMLGQMLTHLVEQGRRAHLAWLKEAIVEQRGRDMYQISILCMNWEVWAQHDHPHLLEELMDFSLMTDLFDIERVVVLNLINYKAHQCLEWIRQNHKDVITRALLSINTIHVAVSGSRTDVVWKAVLSAHQEQQQLPALAQVLFDAYVAEEKKDRGYLKALDEIWDDVQGLLTLEEKGMYEQELLKNNMPHATRANIQTMLGSKHRPSSVRKV